MEHVFISYVKENRTEVDRLCDVLSSHSIRVWRDKNDIPPGARWPQTIRGAIREGAFFIACFSKEYHERDKTFMNEELTVAIEELRQHSVDRIWFIPVQLNECEIPEFDIGKGETLEVFQSTKLYENWEDGIQRILNVIQPQFPSDQGEPSSESPNAQQINMQEQVHPAAEAYSEAIEIASDQNLVKWRQSFKQVHSTVSTSLVQWGRNELLSGCEPRDGEQFVDESVDIISPFISAALAGVESGQEHFKNQKSVLNNLLSVSDSDLDRSLTWERILYTLGYVYHSLHGAISLNTEQVDLALDLAKVKVKFWGDQNFESLWKASPFMGWSQLIGENHCTEGWKYLSSAYNRWEWLGSIFSEESEYRVSLVAYYMALNIHELASVIASGQQATLNTNHLKEFCVPLTFISEERDINQRAISMLQSNPEALTELWTSLDVTRAEMEDSWKNWIYKCGIWLRNIYGFGSYTEVYHTHFFESF